MLENILLTEASPSALCKLCDFGLATSVAHAKGYDGRNAYSIKSCQAIVDQGYFGTLATMAPEVMQEDGGGYGPQCDVYSAGCVIYSIISGFHAFDAANMDTFEQHVRARPLEAPAPVEFPEWQGAPQL